MTMPGFKELLMIEGVGAAAIVRLKVATFELPLWSVTVIEKFEVPLAVGVPEIKPVLALKFKPAGKVPVPTAKV